MKKMLILVLAGSLMMAGCAGKKVVEEPPVAEVAPPVVEKPSPVVAEKAPVPEPVVAEPVAPEPVAVEPAAERIFFDFDSCRLTSASKQALEDNARWLQDQEEVRIIIEGHADERGSDTYNLSLGEKRAQAAREYLVTLGVDADRINIISYGEERAVQGAASEEVWAKDRRAEFVKAN